MATMSLLGLYRYNPSVVSELVLPDGVDRDTLIDNLLAETAEMELLYSDLPFMQAMIGRWSAKELNTWTELYATTQYEYNPIENYERYEEWTDENGHNVERNRRELENSSSTFKGETSGTVDSTSRNDSINAVSAYNELDFTNKDRQSVDGSTDTETENSSESETDFKSSVTHAEDENGQNLGKHVGHTHGNIGVTTTQHMILEQRRVVKFNIYDYIINSFKNRFCLMVY